MMETISVLQAVDTLPGSLSQGCVPRQLWNRVHLLLRDRVDLVFVILIVVHLIPLWAFPYFPSQDGPAHLENANILRQYDQPDQVAFYTYYVLNPTLTPNWLDHLLLAGLLSVLPMLAAEKVFLSGYIILFPLAVRYAVSAVQIESAFLGVLTFPFIYNYLFHMGFYGFAYSLPLFFFVCGYWIKYREQFYLPQIIILAILASLLYFGHIVSMAAAFLVLVWMTIWPILLRLRAGGLPHSFPLAIDRNALQVLRPFYALVPAITLFAIFFFQTKRYNLPVSWEDKPPLGSLLNQFFSLYALVSYEWREIWISRGVVCLFAAITMYLLFRRRTLRPLFGDGFVVVAAVFTSLYFIGPAEMGGAGYIHDRVSLYPFLVLILWFAAHSYGPIAKRCIASVTIGLAILLLGLHTIKYVELNRYLEEYLAGMDFIQPNTTILPIYFSERGEEVNSHPISLRINFLLNAAGYLSVERGVVNLGNYEAGQTRYFPTLFRPALNPNAQIQYLPLDGASGERWAVPTGILSYPQRTKGQIDYVLLWGVREQDYSKETPKFLFAQLQQNYDLLYNSSKLGLMKLYRRKEMSFSP